MAAREVALIIRAAENRDVPAIAAIYAEAVLHGTASFELDPPDGAEMARRREALVTDDHPYLAAEIDGIVAGYAYAGPYRPRLAYRSTVESSVYVAPTFHGRGIGGGLLRALVTAASVRGFRQMVAVIGDSANQASIRLHERCGFEPVGTLRSVGWKHGRWLDTVLMQRSLGPGDAIPSDLGRPA